MGSVLTVVAGLALLTAGGEAFIRGASRLARGFGISPLLVGLTVVALGTSSPEVAVVLGAALSGAPDIALGNVVGSNIANVLLILGAGAVVRSLAVSSRLVRLDVPLMIGVSALVLVLGRDGAVGRLDGIALLVLLGGYLAFLVRAEHRAWSAPAAAADENPKGGLVHVAWMIAGLALLAGGARLVVTGGSDLAVRMGASELVVGLTVVAVGTSLPEFATVVAAARRGETDFAVGNVVGSNILNLLLVLALAAVIAPGGIAVPLAAFSFDLPIMIAAAAACLPIFFTGREIARWEGFVFLGYYAAYVTFLVLDGTGHEALPLYEQAFLWFVLPLTVVTLAVLVGREARGRRG